MFDKWVKHEANPVLERGKPGDFDHFNIHAPMVVYHDSRYWMFYSGGPVGPPDDEYVEYQLSLATSEDGIDFNKIGKPIIDLGDRDNFHTCMAVLRKADGSLLIEDGLWKAWFNGNRANDLEYIISQDGINWVKHPASPVTTNAYSPTIIKDNGLYRMWHTINTYGEFDIAYAESKDGLCWEHRDKPVLVRGKGWDSYNVLYPHVLKQDGIYYMFYTGMSSSKCYMGVATSNDGLDWEKYTGNPVISPGPEKWDSVYASCSSLVKNPDGSWSMYYAGRKDTIHKYHAIGLACLET
ncbi:hypothetical protein GF312_01545 [Candidatus Poribacteria bacterium]|nr:hypothetical protein [Candidatus Poribacteria bacterium]